ncbi:hypothetical protein, partial [Roseateles sp. P5_E1]
AALPTVSSIMWTMPRWMAVVRNCFFMVSPYSFDVSGGSWLQRCRVPRHRMPRPPLAMLVSPPRSTRGRSLTRNAARGLGYWMVMAPLMVKSDA